MKEGGISIDCQGGIDRLKWTRSLGQAGRRDSKEVFDFVLEATEENERILRAPGGWSSSGRLPLPRMVIDCNHLELMMCTN